MKRETPNRLPFYRRIYSLIQNQIKSGELKPGDAVMSERDLARSQGVSLMTARHALRELELAGFVERRRGAGTFVALPKIQFNKLVAFTEQMANRGISSQSRVLCARIVQGSQDVSAHLSLPGDEKLVKLERLRHADGQPYALEVCYLPAEQFSGLVRAPLKRSSLFMTLEKDYGLQLSYADEEVDATGADVRTAKLLNVPVGSPVLRVRQALYSTAGRAIVYTLALYRSDRHSLLVRRCR